MVDTIRTKIYKVPHDIDFIIGIERSGMIAASIISEYLNVPLIGLESFVSGGKPAGGHRLELTKQLNNNKILVIDDTCNSGKAMSEVKDKLKGFDYEFIYMVVYLEGIGQRFVDIYLEDLRKYTNLPPYIVLYEWNILNHYSFYTQKFMFDMDGIFCLDPPDENNTEEYENYIKDATPLFIPKVPIGKIVTYRLSKYYKITEDWLDKQGIKYDQLIMFDGNSVQERYYSGISPELLKGTVYKNDSNYILFIESDDWQAQNIHAISKKPVLCLSTNKLYQ